MRTHEVRWFYKEPLEPFACFFEGLPQGAATFEQRTDRYLIPVLEQGVGVKIRANRIEVKSRIGNPVPVQIAPGLNGFRETWVKYGFDLQADQETGFSLGKAPGDWLEVYKQRWVTLVEVSHQNWNFHPAGTNPSNWVQLEYTRVRILNRDWYTFGLEWAAAATCEIPEHFFSESIPPGSLQLKESMSYPTFLNQQVVLR